MQAYGTCAETILGEMLLYVFMEQELNAPKIMSKIEIDDLGGMSCSKSDGVHLLAVENNGQLFHQLVFGASDIYGDLTASIDRAFDKIIDIENNSDIELKMVENTTHNNIYDPDTTNYMIDLLLPKKSNVPKPDMAYGVFLGYTLSLDYKETDNNKYRTAVKTQMQNDVEGISTPIREAFSPFLDEYKEYKIREIFPIEKTSVDINFSYDQVVNLRELVKSGQKYPKVTGENDEVDFEELVDFLMKLRKVFKWDIYEKRTIGKAGAYREDSVIRWYAVILLRWIRDNGLNQIIYHALKYKENNPNTGVWVGNMKLADIYNKNSKLHKNYIIAETLGVIENVLLFSISNYFKKFSLEYKNVHQVDHFQND